MQVDFCILEYKKVKFSTLRDDRQESEYARTMQTWIDPVGTYPQAALLFSQALVLDRKEPLLQDIPRQESENEEQHLYRKIEPIVVRTDGWLAATPL